MVRGPLCTTPPTGSEHQESDEEEDSTYYDDENSTIKHQTNAWAEDAVGGITPMSICSRRTSPRSLSGAAAPHAAASKSLVVEIPRPSGKISCAKSACPKKKRRKINLKMRRAQVSSNGTAVM
jgi:hypothetical protein